MTRSGYTPSQPDVHPSRSTGAVAPHSVARRVGAPLGRTAIVRRSWPPAARHAAGNLGVLDTGPVGPGPAAIADSSAERVVSLE